MLTYLHCKLLGIGSTLLSVGLYPFASLAQTDEPELVLREVAARIEEIPKPKLQKLTTKILTVGIASRQRIGSQDSLLEVGKFDRFDLSDATN